MNKSPIAFSIFEHVLFPEIIEDNINVKKDDSLVLKKTMILKINKNLFLKNIEFVIFDFETTGLDPNYDRIIEIGGVRLKNFKKIEEFSCLIDPGIKISKYISSISGITTDMIKGKPNIFEILPKFLSFIKGAVLIAHNAEFDMKFLKSICNKKSIELNWPALCTLKMAKSLLPDLTSKSLDALADYYKLKFESRHRSLGDVKVTSDVFINLLEKMNNIDKIKFKDLKDFSEF